MTNTFFAEGTDDEEAMLATMGDGLFAAKMGGGSVKPSHGEFNFAVLKVTGLKTAKILCCPGGATLIGKGADVLYENRPHRQKDVDGSGHVRLIIRSVPTMSASRAFA